MKITKSEEKLHSLFLDLAKLYFLEDDIKKRLSELLQAEAEIVKNLPLQAAVH